MSEKRCETCKWRSDARFSFGCVVMCMNPDSSERGAFKQLGNICDEYEAWPAEKADEVSDGSDE